MPREIISQRQAPGRAADGVEIVGGGVCDCARAPRGRGHADRRHARCRSARQPVEHVQMIVAVQHQLGAVRGDHARASAAGVDEPLDAASLRSPADDGSARRGTGLRPSARSSSGRQRASCACAEPAGRHERRGRDRCDRPISASGPRRRTKGKPTSPSSPRMKSPHCAPHSARPAAHRRRDCRARR